MPAAKANGFLDDTLKSDEHRFGTVISGDDDLGMARENGEFLLATVPTALQVRETAIDGTLHSLNHFRVSELNG